jgi:DNA-binding winged helix-turn-helix (wHTH) protein/Tfp pilus assembly protein PilF
MQHALAISPAIRLADEPPFALGALRVDPARRSVAMGGAPATILEPRVMQALVALADAGGRVVGRDELIERCWEGVVVGDAAINRVIAILRKLAAETGAFTIETVARVGYRLLVERAAATDEAPADLARPPADGRPVADGGPTAAWDAADLPAGLRAQALAALLPPATAASPPRAATPGLGRRALLAGGLAGLVAAAAGGVALWRSRPAPAPSPAAELEARARDALAYMLPERDAEALALFKEAVAFDPASATAWAGLATAHQRLAELGLPSRAQAHGERALGAARRATQLDPRQADAAAVLALLPPTYRNWLAREADYLAFLDRRPGHAGVLAALAKLQMEVGRVAEATATMTRALDREPLSPSSHWRLALMLWSGGRLAEAEGVIDRGARRWPRQNTIWFVRFWIAANTGHAREAIAMAQDRTTRPVDVPDHEFERVALAARALDTRAAADIEATMAAYRQGARETATGAEVGMLLASTLGRLDEAVAIARAYFLGEGFAVPAERMSRGMFNPLARRNTTVLFWPPASALRADRRFAALARDIGLADYWARSGKRPDFRR